MDRYQAYQAIDQVKGGQMVLAFCWAHVRRDFVTVARTWPEQEGWALGWVERIGQLYQLNAATWELRIDGFTECLRMSGLKMSAKIGQFRTL